MNDPSNLKKAKKIAQKALTMATKENRELIEAEELLLRIEKSEKK